MKMEIYRAKIATAARREIAELENLRHKVSGGSEAGIPSLLIHGSSLLAPKNSAVLHLLLAQQLHSLHKSVSAAPQKR